MNRRVRSLSEHFCYIALAKVDRAACIQLLERSFKRFGPVQTDVISDPKSAFRFLLPLKSFATRYLILETSGWCLCVSDMIGESCFVDVYALSRATRCLALAAEFGATQRSFRYLEDGAVRRSISCYRDGDDWFFDQMGLPLKFETVECYGRSDRAERLTPALVTNYLTHFSQIEFPVDFHATPFTSICGIQRSLQTLRVPPEQFFVDDEL